MSADSAGVQADDDSFGCWVSGDGRFTTFWSGATNLVAGDTNRQHDVFLHDRRTGLTTRVSVDSAGAQANGASIFPSISADGRLVAFQSRATNLVSGDTNRITDVFVHDTKTGSTMRASVDSSGMEGNASSDNPSLSADGRFVAFWSGASNLITNDTNGTWDVFVHDLKTRITERVSVDASGAEADLGSYDPAISADGRFVAFRSSATNLVPGDSNRRDDIFVHDRVTGYTLRASIDSTGAQANGDSRQCSISGDGRFVAFKSWATNLVPGDNNLRDDVFLRDLANGITSRVSVDPAGGDGNGDSSGPSLSANGRFVAFSSQASNLVPGDSNAMGDAFVRDCLTATTRRVSVDSTGAEADWGGGSASISQDGRIVGLVSFSTNLVPGDTNGELDSFVHGPYLTLEADPTAPPPGSILSLSTWTGLPAGRSMVAVIDVNGIPVCQNLASGAFDSKGLWLHSGTVPPGLSGSVFKLLGFGFTPVGTVEATNVETVAFP